MKNLKLVTTVYLVVGVMLAVTLTATAMTAWTSQRAAWLSNRANLAHEVYEGYLSLSAHAYQLFKQYGDALVIGDRDLGSGESELISAARDDIARIRQLTAGEIEYDGSGESADLEVLAEIEAKMNRLIAALETYRTGMTEDGLRSGWSELSAILDSEIDQDFRAQIDSAIAEETKEVAAARAEIARHNQMNRVFAMVSALVTLVAAAGAVILVKKRLSVPVARVIEGVEAFGTGNYDHRIALTGRHELSQIGGSLDTMAAKIQERAQSVLEQRADLERLVADRTSQLEATLDRVQEAGRNRRTLLTDVSHELKTPLTIIRGEADIALRAADQNPGMLRTALERTRDAASHTARIVDDLLFIARTEEGKPRISAETTDLAKLLRGVVRTFASDLAIIGAEQPATVVADAGRIRQVVLILYDNAKRHGGNEILFRLEQVPDGYRVTVEDDGPGMPDAEKAQAFERFFRGSGTTLQSTSGIGLGLPVARAIVEAHGGIIALADRPGGGLAVSFTLPGLRRLRAVS